MNLEPTDELFRLGHGSVRSLDCIMAVAVDAFPEAEDFKRAQQFFPKTAAYPVRIERTQLPAFINAPLRDDFELRIGLIQGEERLLALKMSHVLGDAVSMLLWLKVALGGQVDASAISPHSYPRKKDTAYRSIRNSERWAGEFSQSKEREFIRLKFEHPGNLPVNNLMIKALLESLPFERKSIWVPVNVRRIFWQGFGNALSRMRIYPPTGLDFINQQKREAFKSGEVFTAPRDFQLGGTLRRLLLRSWIHRPWADWGSISLSHIEDKEDFLPIKEAWGISNIMPAHQGAIFAFTKGEATQVTLSFDKAVKLSVAQKLMNDFKRNFQEGVCAFLA